MSLPESNRTHACMRGACEVSLIPRTDVPADVLLAHVVCKTLVPPARKVGLYLPDLLHVLVVRCITRAPHTCPIRHRLIRCIDYRLPVAAHICCTDDAIEKAYFARAVEIWRSDNCKHCLHVSLFLFQRLAQSKPSQSRHLCSESWQCLPQHRL